MRCPFCKEEDSRVIDSRSADDGNSIRRRRECSKCGRRFTTYEVVEKTPLMVIKHDGRRVQFDRDKLLKGLIRSCDKRDIPTDRIVALADEIERELRNTMEREITTKSIGELVMEKLKNFDEVAYIRFASVYRKFADISMFKEELEELLREKREK
ncbi:transcriptional regulator NrdR [Schwartzia succinivorans]|jgi:transcriptional repressor NrdR|uniref:Transcriptional repressor NrdR n=1 Tax=Schwartzia succinivorans DSM 10502 TaxID=1123243 RepID=A0A1M4USC3_9FIRM|nr:transcriptional regulator NrdR [Schwartzia succinivorans]SHE59510.1 transcriptional repressor NrdR [Schwartzia succinivorans DSM 10502]